MKFNILLALLLLLSTTNTYAVNEKQEAVDAQNQMLLELFEKENELQQIKGMQNEVNKNLNDLKNMQISTETKNISITNKSIIELDLHHVHFTKIYLPDGATIISSKSSTEFTNNDIFSNRVELRPTADLLQASISIMFVYNNKNYDVTIIANKYDISNHRNKGDNTFYPKVNFTIDTPIEPKNIIKSYRKDYDKLPDGNQPIFYKYDNKIYVIEKGEFKESSPTNKPNLYVLHDNKIHKYKITLGE